MTKLNEHRPRVDIISINRPLTVILGLLLLYFTVAGRTKILNDADTLWHIAVGRITLDSGLITQDSFSFTRNGEWWVANQWLAECMLAVADSLGGFDGVLVLTATVLIVTYLALAYRWLMRGFDPLLTLAFLAIVLSASAYTINARPHIVSIGLLGLTFALLRDVEDERRSPARLAWLIPIFVLWSNLHGGVLGGLGTFGLVAAGWTVQWFLGVEAPVRTGRDVGLLWLCVAGCGLALVATPYGTGSLQAWISIMSMSLPELIIEHAPLHPVSIQGMLVVVLCILYLVALCATSGAWSRLTFWLPPIWFVLACLRIRHAPLFAIVAGIAMADLLPQSRLAPWLERRRWLSDHRFYMSAVRMAATVLLMTAPLLGAAVWLKHVGSLPLIGAQWASPTPQAWPGDLIAPLTTYAEGQPDATSVFNEPILGGFLIYKFPKVRIFVDGRCELYGETFLRDVVAAWRDPRRVRLWQREFDFRAALIAADSPLRSYFDESDQWRLIAEGRTAMFYRRIQHETTVRE
jgi:hypothetical protein